MNIAKKNFIYNTIYQMLLLIVPIIISPYLARVIGAQGVGIYSYTYSIIYYFMLICMLGVNNYGSRTIAKVRKNKDELSIKFWEIYILQLIIGSLMLIIYYIYILVFDAQYKIISLTQSLFIFSAIFDINWFFFGMEEFKKTITRNSIVKLSSLILIFVFVKSPSDVWKYSLIMSSTTLLSQLVLWFFIKKYIRFKRISCRNISKHLLPNAVLFIPVIAVNIYKMMDKIMLGAIVSVREVGFYENAEKIVTVPLTIIAALGTVMLPRISNIISTGEYEKIKEYILKTMEFISFLSFAMCFGLIATGSKFAPLFFGEEFKKTGMLIIMLSITIPFISFATVLRTQYLIPKEKDKIYVLSALFGAVINLIMNVIFINKYKSIGACIGTIFAEVSVLVFQAISVKKELPIKQYVKVACPYFLKALLMFIIILLFNYINMNDWVRLVLQISVGGMLYIIMNIKYITNIVNIRSLIKRM